MFRIKSHNPYFLFFILSPPVISSLSAHSSTSTAPPHRHSTSGGASLTAGTGRASRWRCGPSPAPTGGGPLPHPYWRYLPLQQRRRRGHGLDSDAVFPSCHDGFHSTLRRPSHTSTGGGFPMAGADAAAAPTRRRLPRPSPPLQRLRRPSRPPPRWHRGDALGLLGRSTSAATPFPSYGGALGAIHAVSSVRLLLATFRVLVAPATPPPSMHAALHPVGGAACLVRTRTTPPSAVAREARSDGVDAGPDPAHIHAMACGILVALYVQIDLEDEQAWPWGTCAWLDATARAGYTSLR